MLPRKNRLDRREVEHVSHKGRRIPSPLLPASYVSGDQPQVAIVISKKVSTSSVVRHFLKRKIAHIIKNEGLVKGKLIFFAQKKVLEATSLDICAEYRKIKKMIE